MILNIFNIKIMIYLNLNIFNSFNIFNKYIDYVKIFNKKIMFYIFGNKLN